jgi:gluconolactonase
MKDKLLIALFAGSAFGFGSAADFEATQPAEFARCIPAGAKVEKLAGGFAFVEGPVWVKSGAYLVFSDIPKDELMKWSPAEGVARYRQPSGNANGNTLDLQGRLLSCEHSGRRIAVRETDGSLKTLVDAFEGRKFNSPNDVVVRSDGTVWFTDPEYGLKRDPETRKVVGREQAGNYVYRFDPKTGRVTAVVKDFVQPNGLAFSPDERLLYVADSGAPKPAPIRVFGVQADGTLDAGRVFCAPDNGAPDGIRVDRDGRVWSSSGDGVQIFGPDGKRVGRILLPESAANLCFGGPEGKTLFMTARTSLYSVPVLVAGAGR